MDLILGGELGEKKKTGTAATANNRMSEDTKQLVFHKFDPKEKQSLVRLYAWAELRKQFRYVLLE